MEISLEDDWNNFLCCGELEKQEDKDVEEINMPKPSDIYISTQTKIAYLNQTVDLESVFWNLPVIPYCCTSEGIIKKQMKINSFTQDKVDEIESRISQLSNVRQNIISFVEPKTNSKQIFKHVQKLTIGYSKKDFTNYRTKEKSAFYNCFALILRVFYEDKYNEVHVKVFNTGKLEIPGIKKSSLLVKTFDVLCNLLQPHISTPISVVDGSVDTVLINSNFTCNYYINRSKLHEILKRKYNLISMFDPCSYPGIQCKFYYNTCKTEQDGICTCATKCSKKGSGTGKGQCIEISFMIFRTGSILIVGNCDEDILQIIYDFIKNILYNEFESVNTGLIRDEDKKIKKKKIRTKQIIFE
jgi:hypothetical protein